MANMREIAKKAGIGIATVSRYFNNSGYVSEEARKKIKKVVDENDYTPNALARAIFTKDTQIIGVLIPNITNPFFNQMIGEMEKVFMKNDYTMMMYNTDDNEILEKQHLDTLKSYRVDGIIAMRTMTPESYRNLDIPVISFENKISDKIVNVSADNYKGGAQAFRHLYNVGCRKILHIQGPSEFTATIDRTNGFVDASKKKKDVFVDVVKLESDFHVKILEPIIANINNIEQYDGIFVFNDISAAVVMKHLRSRGISVPNDTKVIGFDNSFIGELLQPSLTSIDQPIKSMSNLIAELLIKQIKGIKIVEKEHIINTALVKRESTGLNT